MQYNVTRTEEVCRHSELQSTLKYLKVPRRTPTYPKLPITKYTYRSTRCLEMLSQLILRKMVLGGVCWSDCPKQLKLIQSIRLSGGGFNLANKLPPPCSSRNGWSPFLAQGGLKTGPWMQQTHAPHEVAGHAFQKQKQNRGRYCIFHEFNHRTQSAK